MAKRVTKSEKFWNEPSRLTRTEKATYPWDDWLDGNTWRIVQGEDFYPHPLMMERIIRTRATGRNAKIRMRHLALDATDEANPFGIIILERTDLTPETNGKAPAKAAAKATKANGSKAPTKRVPAKQAQSKQAQSKAVPLKPAKRAAAKAPEVTKTPVKRQPAARAPKSVKVDGPAPVAPKPSKKAARKVPVPA